MIRKIIADTPVNDINKGSLLLTLLEAAAANDYENNTSILNVLELLNIDALQNNDLDAYASNFGLKRNTAAKASGFVKIIDSTITKRSTTLYPVKPAPITGTTVLHVNDATGWNQTGVVYLGRGTPNFEGPLAYTSITDNGTFFTIQLSSALEKDHLISETVVDGQGTTDRQIVAGTIVKIPSNNIDPEIQYSILRDAVIPAGEDTVEDIPVTAIKAGSAGNAGINSITFFNILPFTGAQITNTNAFSNGRDVESDDQFRNRIKAYSSSLARGTKASILSAINGVSDETEGKQVASAVITEPAKIGDPSIVYVDDGSGFEPSYSGQSVDLLIASASGNEEFLQLANYPLPRPQIVNNAEAPFLLTDSMELKVLVDDIEESVIFTSSDFRSISSATISEVVVAINDKATSFKARLTEDSTRILIYPVNYKAETIQVTSDGTVLDANTQLKFPVNEFSYIALYQNNKRLREIQKSASVISSPFSTWQITGTGNLILSIDGTPDQDRTFDTTDFGGTNFNALTIEDYVTAFNAKFAGITATSTTTGRIIISSNKEGSASSIEIVGGSYIEKMFGGQELESVGQDSDFALNRQNGNLQIKKTIVPGDVISAGSDDTKGNIISGAAVGGNFSLATDSDDRPAEMVVVVDANRVLPRSVNLAVGTTITLTNEGNNIMRIMASAANSFKEIQPDDFIYITNRGDIDGSGSGTWIDLQSCGLFKVNTKGEHTSDGVDTYVEVTNVNMIVGGSYTVQDSVDVQAFYSDVYPQIFRGTMTSNPAAATMSDVINSLTNNIIGISAKIFRTNYIKMTSITEEGGSIAVPVSVGNMAQLFVGGGIEQKGIASHIANKVQTIDAVSIFESTKATNTNVWLDRYVYTDIKGNLTAAVEPSKDGSGTYSEILTDTATTTDFETDISYDSAVSITSGQNKQQTRNIRSIIDSDNIGTRHEIPRTILDYNVGDEYQAIKNLEFSADDSVVAIIDKDSVAKTIDIAFSRTGRINSGSQSGTYIPTNLAFSADDADNEPGIDFGSLSVWGTLPTQSNANFDDYAVWMRARNWYVSNGAALVLRAKEYGPNGDKIRFKTDYPVIANTANTVSHLNTPDSTIVTYTFGSGAAALTQIAPADKFAIASLGGNNFRITYPATATTTNINIGDVLIIDSNSGFSLANTGSFRVNAKNDANRTIDIYNPNGVATIVGSKEIQSVTCIGDVADSLDASWFVLTAPNGDTVKFWYDMNNAGTIEPAIGTTTRSYEINPITGDSSVSIATLTAAAIMSDVAFLSATNAGGTSPTITVTMADNGPCAIGYNGSTSPGFSYSTVTAGIADTFETLNIISAMRVVSLTGTSTADIVSKINESDILTAVVVTAGTIDTATREETSGLNILGYDHDSNPLNGKNEYVSMWDSKSWVLTFQNANPNFQLKVPLILSGISASYQEDTVPNEDGTQGEYFKLVPVTITNIKHQLTHKALSQLDIVADVAISNDGKKLQLKSQELGSSGAIEIVGGRANIADFKILGDSQIINSAGTNYLAMKIPASPNTLTPGQHVALSNDFGVERLNRQIATDTMDVVKINDNTFEYRYNNKSLVSFNQYTAISIADANSIDPVSYPTPGLVWRWTHNDSGTALVLTDTTVGAVSAQPTKYSSNGTLGGATNIVLTVVDPGSSTTALNFLVNVIGSLTQGDYIRFVNNAGQSYAAWASIDGDVTPPTGATYISAINKVMVSILSSDTPNQIASKLLSALLTDGIATDFDVNVTSPTSLAVVRAGNLVNPVGAFPGWSATNKSMESGDDFISGFPIVKVDVANRYFDVVNPYGATMPATAIGASSDLIISSTPIIEWKLAHSSYVKSSSVTISGGIATMTTIGAHRLNVGSTFSLVDAPASVAPSVPGAGFGTVISVLGPNQFTYATTQPNAASITPAGLVFESGRVRTRYKIESLGYNDLYRLKAANGDSPKFMSSGVAVDDIMIISGSTFNAINSGEFRVLAVDEDSVIYKNTNAVEELNTLIDFNSFNLPVNWVSSSTQITGIAGAFANVNIGDWVKKETDDDTQYRQVISFNTINASDATIVTLGSSYNGISSSSTGVKFDQNSDVGQGVYLDNMRDIRFLEGDSTRAGDKLFITESVNVNWFEVTNSGTFTINAIGTSPTDGKIYLRVENGAGIAETNVVQGVLNTKLSIIESDANKFTTIKKIHHVAVDEFNPEKRIVYLTPGNRSYKWSETNATSIISLGKLGYDANLVTGVDGYLYYTGLLRKVQRIIDGFEPDSANFPGRKAVGSLIEVLPPLPRRVSIAIDVTTEDGVNLSEISDEITSTIINYVSDLGVGEDVILSDIIVRVKSIDGVAAVTFVTPEPSKERIAISSNEKAFVEPNDISVA